MIPAHDSPPVRSPSTPEVGAKVEIIGERGTYLVVRVDHQRYTADLMLMGPNAKMELGVHFSGIHILPDTRKSSFHLTWRRLMYEPSDEVR